ncbi:MAG: hypothetical protein COB93_04565 [Sneathiella sp.]|nr:MAG: hypothetical protein COB93_04565 [Sneathiella sp.]
MGLRDTAIRPADFDITCETHWRELLPDLTIGASQDVSEIEFSPHQLDEIADAFWETGYLCVPPVLTEVEIRPLRQAMGVLRTQALPPVYIYLFDQPWQLFARLRPLLRHFLGDQFAVLPNLWAWHLAAPGDRGWPLHRDCDAETVFNIGPDQLLMSLSLWLPLTDVDVDNGCMFILPRSKMSGYSSVGSDKDIRGEDKVALPAASGSVLGWAQDVYHWGGPYSAQAKNPRISLSLEFQNCAFDPLIEPLLDMSALPSFGERLALIEGQFDKYRHINPGADLTQISER